jgi:hypothetical protein
MIQSVRSCNTRFTFMVPRVAELLLCLSSVPAARGGIELFRSNADPVLTPMSSPSFVLTTFSMCMPNRIIMTMRTPGVLGCSCSHSPLAQHTSSDSNWPRYTCSPQYELLVVPMNNQSHPMPGIVLLSTSVAVDSFSWVLVIRMLDTRHSGGISTCSQSSAQRCRLAGGEHIDLWAGS